MQYCDAKNRALMLKTKRMSNCSGHQIETSSRDDNNLSFSVDEDQVEYS